MRILLRLCLTAGVVLAIIATTLVLNARDDRAAVSASTGDSLKKGYDATAANTTAGKDAPAVVSNADGSHTHAPGTPPHSDSDPATKNAVSRAATTTDAETADPTTPQQAEQHERSAAEQRKDKKVRLRHVVIDPAQPEVPTDRYNLFNACYGLRSTATGGWLSGTSFGSTSTRLFFKPTDLGSYLLYSTAGTYLGRNLLGRLTYLNLPSSNANWIVTQAGRNEFRLQLQGAGYLAVNGNDVATLVAAPNGRTQFTPHRRDGCRAFPEVQVNVSGDPTAGVSGFQETRGYVDAHTHGMAFEFLGGDVHCGRPWSPWGVETALKDCPDHTLTGGTGAVMEAFLSGKVAHDPVGWPTFKDWPAPGSLTHEGTYYKWMERSWRAGQRILVNLLVENNQLCQLYPLKRNSCDDMTSLRLQAEDMRKLERYVDAQHGGPGRGWYRIVTTPQQARAVINSGRMAVVMGIETSVLFGCHSRLGRPTCTAAEIDRQLDAVQRMGVVQMELVNKFDNALAGVAGDEGTTGYLVNTANTLETGSPWRMTTCSPNDAEVHDKDQGNSASIPSQDALFGAVLKVLPPAVLAALPAVPVYPAKHHCNTLGLSPLGAHTIAGMAERHMIFDPDHMSVKARKQSLDLIDRLRYPGVISSHSWSTPDAYPRIYAEGGFITPYAGDSTGFVAKWKRHLTWANPKTYWGFGFGADINGLGAQGDPRPGAAANPVTYPFKGLGGVVVDRQVSGSRVYDINRDGVAHYGLYPDWIEDLRKLAGDRIVEDMARGAEAYLQMWERAYGVEPDSCASPRLRKKPRFFAKRVHKGSTWWTVVRRAGQPHRRAGSTFTYCAKKGKRAVVTFTPAGKVKKVRVR